MYFSCSWKHLPRWPYPAVSQSLLRVDYDRSTAVNRSFLLAGSLSSSRLSYCRWTKRNPVGRQFHSISSGRGGGGGEPLDAIQPNCRQSIFSLVTYQTDPLIGEGKEVPVCKNCSPFFSLHLFPWGVVKTPIFHTAFQFKPVKDKRKEVLTARNGGGGFSSHLPLPEESRHEDAPETHLRGRGVVRLDYQPLFGKIEPAIWVESRTRESCGNRV